MRKKIKLTESELRRLIMNIVEQTDDESEKQYHHLTPEKYLELMNIASYNGNFFKKIKQYKDKPIWIDGDLNVNGLPIKYLGPIAGISGKLDISRTNISSIDGIQVTGYVSDYDTPRARIREKQELNAKLGEQESLRDNDEWMLERGDETGEKAHALFQWLENNGDIEPLSEDDREKLTILRNKLVVLEKEYDETEDDDRVTELTDAIEETQEEIDELEENDVDVYMMYPNSRYSHYGLQHFEVLIDGFKDREYTVGTEEEMDEAALAYVKTYIDDVGTDGFNSSFIEDYLDVDAIVRMAEEDYEYSVRDSPESYFNDDDFELTSEQEERIEELEAQIADLEQQQWDLDSEQEDYEELYDDFQINIDTLQEELDGIEVETEPTDEMIDDKVQELVRDVKRDPLDYLREYGLPIKEYIDEDELAKGLVDSDGWGIMNSYDGTYDSEDVNGETYYIMRTN
jgi:hypothetical protein